VATVLSAAWAGLAPLLIARTVHLAVGLFRHVYDTRVFTLVYADLAADLVERQRAQGADAAHVAARNAVARSRRLPSDRPAAVAATLVHFVDAVAMLCILNRWVGALAVLALLPIGLFTLWFGRASLRLNAALNDRLEREVALVARGSNAGVRRHLAHRLRFWRVRISDAEARVWGGIEVVQIGLTLAALALLARESAGVLRLLAELARGVARPATCSCGGVACAFDRGPERRRSAISERLLLGCLSRPLHFFRFCRSASRNPFVPESAYRPDALATAAATSRCRSKLKSAAHCASIPRRRASAQLSWFL
jgi:hypothetical protein